MAASKVEIYTTDFALDAQGAHYKGLIIVNKVNRFFQNCKQLPEMIKRVRIQINYQLGVSLRNVTEF